MTFVYQIRSHHGSAPEAEGWTLPDSLVVRFTPQGDTVSVLEVDATMTALVVDEVGLDSADTAAFTESVYTVLLIGLWGGEPTVMVSAQMIVETLPSSPAVS